MVRQTILVAAALVMAPALAPVEALAQVPEACRGIDPWAAGLAERSMT